MEYFRSRKRLHLTGNSVHATISGWTQMALQFTVDIGRNFAHKDAPCVQASMKGRFLQSYPRHVYSYHKMFLGKNNYCFHYCFHVYINQFHVGISFKALIISDQMMKVLLQNFRGSLILGGSFRYQWKSNTVWFTISLYPFWHQWLSLQSDGVLNSVIHSWIILCRLYIASFFSQWEKNTKKNKSNFKASLT